jgi:hypothetical protein
MSTELTPERRAEVLAQLCDPFPANEVLWRSVRLTKDKVSGEMAAYAKKRTYRDRLNQLFGTSGWTATFSLQPVLHIPRTKGNQTISTGKLAMTCTLSIDGFGTHESTGEGWADDDNGLTIAESQSFLRACAYFGLGSYIEVVNSNKPWVKVNQYGVPLKTPELPSWALPAGVKALMRQPQAGTRQGPQPVPAQALPQTQRPNTQQTNVTPKPGTVGNKPSSDQTIDQQFLCIRKEVGETLFNSVVAHVTSYFDQGKYSGDKNAKALECFQRAQLHIQKLRDMSERIGETRFGVPLDEYTVPSLSAFTSIDQLMAVVRAAENIAVKAA